MYYLWHDAQLLVAWEIAQKHLVDLFFCLFTDLNSSTTRALRRTAHTKEVASGNGCNSFSDGRRPPPPISDRVNTGYFYYPSVRSSVWQV